MHSMILPKSISSFWRCIRPQIANFEPFEGVEERFLRRQDGCRSIQKRFKVLLSIVQEAFLEGPTWLREAFEALQSASKHQSDVTNLCFGSILFKIRFLNDVSHENPIFVLSCRLQEAFESPPGGIGKPSKRFEALLNTYKMSHLCGLAVSC